MNFYNSQFLVIPQKATLFKNKWQWQCFFYTKGDVVSTIVVIIRMILRCGTVEHVISMHILILLIN